MSRILRVEHDHKAVTLHWDGGHESRFHHFWLRDNSPQARHPETGHRVEETSLLDAGIQPVDCALNGEGELSVRWSDGHESCWYSEPWFGPADNQRREHGTRAPEATMRTTGRVPQRRK